MVAVTIYIYVKIDDDDNDKFSIHRSHYNLDDTIMNVILP